ncbi:MAG: twin transmembrane helix small protein [Rickettsiales bacterium]
MHSAMVILLFVLMLATVGVLISGIVVMARGGETNKKYGNKMMAMRVTLQGAALLLVVLLMVMK